MVPFSGSIDSTIARESTSYLPHAAGRHRLGSLFHCDADAFHSGSGLMAQLDQPFNALPLARKSSISSTWSPSLR